MHEPTERRTTSTRELVARRRRGCGYCGGTNHPCDSCRAYEDGVLDGAEQVVENLSQGLTCTCPDEPESCEAHAHLTGGSA